MKPHFTPPTRWKVPKALRTKIMYEFLETGMTAQDQAKKYPYSWKTINTIQNEALEMYANEQRENKSNEQKKQ